MTHPAFVSFGSSEPVALASRLLFEIERGMVPVWPSTLESALDLLSGLSALRSTRGEEVEAALGLVPKDVALCWDSLLGSPRS